MAIIVGDIHGCVEKVHAFLSFKPDVLHVALGDYLDSFNEPQERQIEALQLLLDSTTVLLWGNHDLHYLSYPLFQFPGYNLPWSDEFNEILECNIDRFLPTCVADGWLCSHAGVNAGLAGGRTVQELDQLFCSEWKAYLDDRTGGYRYKSIYTFSDMKHSFVPDSIKQVHGHDEFAEPGYTTPNCVSIGCNDKGTCWIFDTETLEVKDLGA
jgi:hypothetical protein